MCAKQNAPLEWFPGATTRSLPVLVGGGGSESSFYREAILSTHERFGQRQAGVPPYRLIDLPVPEDFDMGNLERRHFHRFAIAYGLSVPIDALASAKESTTSPAMAKNSANISAPNRWHQR